jgi:hypothetical protein
VKCACESIDPRDVKRLLTVLSPRFQDGQDLKLQQVILRQLAVLLKRGSDFVRAFVAEPFLTAPLSNIEDTADEWLGLFDRIVQTCPALIAVKHFDFLAVLLRLKPDRALCVFSHFVAQVRDISNPIPILDMLYEVHMEIIDLSIGKLLLSLLYGLLKVSPACRKFRVQKVSDVFVKYLTSHDTGTVVTAYAGIIGLKIAVPDIHVICRHLRDSVLWEPAVEYLGIVELVGDEDLIFGLTVRAPESGLVLSMFLRSCGNADVSRLLAKHRNWFFCCQHWPSDTFRLLAALMNHHKKLLVGDPMFGFVLREAVRTGNPDILSEIPRIFRQDLGAGTLTEMSQIGFFRSFLAKIVEYKLFECLLGVLDSIAGVLYLKDYIPMGQVVLQAMNGEDLLAAALEVLIKMARHGKCARMFKHASLDRYCTTLQSYPQFAPAAGKLIAILERSLRQ